MMSAYVLYGLAVCSKNERLDNWQLRDRTRRFVFQSLDSRTYSLTEKAYIIFALSESGKVPQSVVAKLTTQVSGMTAYAKALTALVLINTNNPADAAAVFNSALAEFYPNSNYTKLLYFAGETFENDSVETAAALLLAVVRLKRDEALCENLTMPLIKNRNGMAWKNSRDTAFAVLALSERLKNYRESQDVSKITVSINGTEVHSFSAAPKTIADGDAVYTVSPKMLRAGQNRISIKKSGGAAVYASAELLYIDRSKSFAPAAAGIEITRKYYKVTAEKNAGRLSVSTKETRLFQVGDLIMVECTVRNVSANAKYFMIEDPLVSGCSVVQRDSQYYGTAYRMEYDARQVYDDRAVFFVGGPAESFVIRYFMQAEIPGVYHTLPASASLMYYPAVRANSADNTVEVR